MASGILAGDIDPSCLCRRRNRNDAEIRLLRREAWLAGALDEGHARIVREHAAGVVAQRDAHVGGIVGVGAFQERKCRVRLARCDRPKAADGGPAGVVGAAGVLRPGEGEVDGRVAGDLELVCAGTGHGDGPGAGGGRVDDDEDAARERIEAGSCIAAGNDRAIGPGYGHG